MRSIGSSMLVVFVFCFGSAIVRAADRDLILLELGRDGNPVVEYKLSDGANLERDPI
ncbi:MAG: hypothetical protein HEQ15_03705 [Betaproteobacteria bacterium]